MKTKFYLVSVVLLAAMMFTACGDGCVQCENSTGEDSLELCEDGNTIFTDVDGNEISFDEAVEFWIQQGFSCN